MRLLACPSTHPDLRPAFGGMSEFGSSFVTNCTLSSQKGHQAMNGGSTIRLGVRVTEH